MYLLATGFPLSNGVMTRPCNSWYHPGCFKTGYPFTTRRNGDAGLCLPPKGIWNPFICEACTVRAVCDRELHDRHDWRLMCLERMRLIDMANYWSQGSIKTYASKFSAIARFERTFGVTVFPSPKLIKPPTGQSILLMWAQEFHSLRRHPTRIPIRILMFPLARYDRYVVQRPNT